MIKFTPLVAVRIFFVMTLLVLGIVALVNIPKIGKVAVEIQAYPTNAKITINNEQVRSGTLYLEPGTYTFKATADGYTDEVKQFTLTDTPLFVGLLPEPTSDAAIKYLQDHPQAQADREALGGIIANAEGDVLRDSLPILKELPYTDTNMLYAIDYGVTKDTPSHVFLVINNSTSEGRKNALKWLTEHKVDTATTDIRFGDFANPIVNENI